MLASRIDAYKKPRRKGTFSCFSILDHIPHSRAVMQNTESNETGNILQAANRDVILHKKIDE